MTGIENIHINRNSITNITLNHFYGPYLDPGESWVLDVSNNYWGTTDPTQITTKPGATGTPISYFDFTPMINFGTDGNGTVPGFIPDLSALSVHSIGGQSGTANRIQESVNLVSGSTVNVLAGTYNLKQVKINKPLSLVGVGSATTIINGRGNLDTINDGSDGMILFENISTGSITIDGITIQNTTLTLYDGYYYGDAITFYNIASPITVKNSKFIGSNFGLPYLDFNTWAMFMNYDCGSGVVTIQDNEVLSNNYGFSLYLNGPCTIERNYFHNMEPFSYLISIATENNNVGLVNIQNNNIILPVGNDWGTYGIGLDGYSGGVFQNVNINHNRHNSSH